MIHNTTLVYRQTLHVTGSTAGGVGTHNVLTDVPNGIQRGLLELLHGLLPCDMVHKAINHLRPLADGQLSTRNGCHALHSRHGVRDEGNGQGEREESC